MSNRKTIVVMGTSSVSWEDAVRQVVWKVSESVPDIAAVDVVHHAAHVEDGDIIEFRATVQVSFDRDILPELPEDDEPIHV